jgi:hypothetical protein
MESLEVELDRARALDEDALAAAIESIGFECTRCGHCCKGPSAPRDDDGTNGKDGEPRVDDEEHTATVFPDEIRDLQAATGKGWRDIARPMPYGLDPDGTGETFEWALQTDSCGDCTFYEESNGVGACIVHDDRPLICETYPFSVDVAGTSQPMGGVVQREGPVNAHECEGLGRDITPADAAALASTLKERAIRELEEAIGVRDAYRPVDHDPDDTIVYDSEGPKHADGSPVE